MYIYTVQAMPGSKAQFDGDESVKYQIKRAHTATSAKDKIRTAVIRTDMTHAGAAELVKRFNDKERESRAIKKEADSRLTQYA
jgi:hypothetical protein